MNRAELLAAAGLRMRPVGEVDRLKHRREAWRAVGPGYPDWIREAKAATLAKLDAEIARLERGR